VNWRRVTTFEEGKFPNVSVTHLSVSCAHCAKPACVEACPEEAIYKRQSDGIVLIDAAKCTGCRLCQDACAYGAIQCRSNDAPAEKCDFCSERLKQGEAPICVAACPMRALEFGEYETLKRKAGANGKVAHLPDNEKTGGHILVKPKF
jgi:anaerobic dimethyl sulfoxide reductase subunit B (iron-sulfur subunit)